MKLPEYFTKELNVDISKTIKSLITIKNSTAIIESSGFSFLDLAKSLDKIRPEGRLSLEELKKKKNVVKSAKRFIKIYSN